MQNVYSTSSKEQRASKIGQLDRIGKTHAWLFLAKPRFLVDLLPVVAGVVAPVDLVLSATREIAGQAGISGIPWPDEIVA